MMDHIYHTCTRDYNKGITCSGCRTEGLDCMYETLAICRICGGMEGSLLPECPGYMLSYEENEVNYEHYCNKTGPFEKACRFCGKTTDGFDKHGPLCIDCALVKALKEGE